MEGCVEIELFDMRGYDRQVIVCRVMRVSDMQCTVYLSSMLVEGQALGMIGICVEIGYVIRGCVVL